MSFPEIVTHRGVVVAPNGAVAASQPLAVSVGLRILMQGGTFADAAICTSAVLCVVEPWNSHLGGDAFVVSYDASRRETTAFNGSGAAPASSTPDAYTAGIPLHGPRAATVPGLVSVWGALHKRFGSRPFAELLAPAIAYARDGFPAGPRLARVADASRDTFAVCPDLARLGIDPDVRVGDTIRQPDLAWTLEQIAARGPSTFYSGPVAEKLTQAAHGHFSASDFRAHRTRVSVPLSARYRDLTVWGQPPPSQGHILLQELALAEGFDLATMNEADRTHVLVETKKLAFADRNRYLADPEHAHVPISELLSPTYAQTRRALIRLNHAAPDYEAGLENTGSDTTYFLVRDREGNAVSFIQSIFHTWGSGFVAEGTGVLFNNRMTGFSTLPNSPNTLAPGKRPAHTLNAWLATHADGQLAYVGGTPGAHIQVQTSLQVLVNALDGGMNPQAAIEAPRWQHIAANTTASDPFGPGILEIEDRAGSELFTELARRGHEVRAIGPWAHGSAMQLLQVLPDGVSAVGSDPRCDGQAGGW